MMLKVLLMAACVLLVAACVVLLYIVELIPPSPYHRSVYGDYPPSYIARAERGRVGYVGCAWLRRHHRRKF